MKATFFSKPSEFHKWLDKHHQTEKELLVGFYKVSSGKPSMTWSQSVDEALCYGWIDGVRRSIDEESYSIRFTPRKPKSIWSTININKVKALTDAGLMQPAGMESFAKRTENRSGIYSHEKEPSHFSDEFEKKFKANKKAWKFFKSQAPSYQKVATHVVMTAKQESTRLKRLEELISSSEMEQKMGRLKWGKSKSKK